MYRLIRPLKRYIVSRRIKKIDDNIIPDAPEEIRLFMVVRNESLRLPFIFQYYFLLGVDRMFVIDHGSTDGTRSFLLSQKNTHVFEINDRHEDHPYWFDLLLCQYGAGHWCLVVDADEMVIYPHYEKVSLRELCTFLDNGGYEAMNFVLLDMYSDKPLFLTSYRPDTDPLSVAPYFDPPPYFTNKYGFLYGGMRERVFGVRASLSKFSLFRFRPSMFTITGMHYIKGAKIFYKLRGAVLHFKFLSDFCPRVSEEVRRKEHWRGAREYRVYMRKIKQNPDISLFYPGSVKFMGSDQLLHLGFMKTTKEFDDILSNRPVL